MDEAAIGAYITTTFDGVETVTVNGNMFYFYGPEHMFPFATLMTNDDNDTASDLNRPGIFRLNIGIDKATFHALLGGASPAPDADTAAADAIDFTVLDQILPHPVYGRMFWVCILNPSGTTFANAIQPLLIEAYDRAVARERRRLARG
ncbi:MAG TPA: DUF6194 family protein [Thermomicrobiales bacterium]|jgi:hypothetical protein